VVLSKYLQKPTIDLNTATGLIADTLTVLNTKRSQVEEVFGQLFSEIKELAAALDTNIEMPRLAGRQTFRDNTQSQSVEAYYKISVYIPLLDNVITDLKSRLSKDTMALFNLKVFMPKCDFSEEDVKKVQEASIAYGENFIGHTPKEIVAEYYHLWSAKWRREAAAGMTLPTSVMEALR